jgi:SAM-dependent methyltransferase
VTADAQGLAFDTTVVDYERGRTEWPESVVDGIAAEHVLDLAAGTGKLTRVLTRYFARVTAVEPLPEMRRLGADLASDAVWLEGSAEDIPLADGSVDAAFVAEAYHWFDSARATRELARVLRPASPLIVLFTVWNGKFDPGLPPDAMDAFSSVSQRTGVVGAAKWMTGAWQAGFEDASFGPFAQREVPFEHVTDTEGVISYFLSISTIAARPAAERDELAATLRLLTPPGEHRLPLAARIFQTTRI